MEPTLDMRDPIPSTVDLMEVGYSSAVYTYRMLVPIPAPVNAMLDSSAVSQGDAVTKQNHSIHMAIDDTSVLVTMVTTDVRFGLKVGKISPKWAKSEIFSDQIQYIFNPFYFYFV